jgi:hypothetical protein
MELTITKKIFLDEYPGLIWISKSSIVLPIFEDQECEPVDVL